ncbi:MAG: hypothetical protein Q4D04_10825 [Clostridia bacterium]|nr:hypothetical protein [Clostridia bacterium]
MNFGGGSAGGRRKSDCKALVSDVCDRLKILGREFCEKYCPINNERECEKGDLTSAKRELKAYKDMADEYFQQKNEAETALEKERRGKERLMESLAGVMDDAEGHMKTEEKSVQDMTGRLLERIETVLFQNGAVPIEDDAEFDANRHVTASGPLPRRGSAIISTKRPGISVNGRVVRRALVEVEKQRTD